jgi:dipeptidyl aminopeptidase/acylaminoacyl peptidase
VSQRRKSLILPTIVLLGALCCAGVQAARFLSGVFLVNPLPPRLDAGEPLGEGEALAFSLMRLDLVRPFQIYLLDDAGGVRALTWGVRTADTAPLWSPDGRRLVYASASGGVTRHRLIDAEGAALGELAPDGWHQASPRWSPDGSRLAYLSYDRADDGSIEPAAHLCVTEVDTGETHRGPAGDIADLAWLPDGPSLLAIVRGEDGVTVELYDAEGAHGRRLFEADFLRDAVWIALSPGAGRVAYFDLGAGKASEAEDVLTIAALDGSATWPVGNVAVDGPVTWSPDGARVAFVALTADYAYALYVAEADGTGLRELLVLNPGDESGEILPAAPAWSPDGTRLAIGSVIEPDEAAILLVNADGSGRQQVLTAGGAGAMIYDLAWRPGE